MAKKRLPDRLGFKQSLNYVLDVLCFAYYVKDDNLVSDSAFDELEKIWKRLTATDTAPMRGIEREFIYSHGVHVVYDELKKSKNKQKKES